MCAAIYIVSVFLDREAARWRKRARGQIKKTKRCGTCKTKKGEGREEGKREARAPKTTKKQAKITTCSAEGYEGDNATCLSEAV